MDWTKFRCSEELILGAKNKINKYIFGNNLAKIDIRSN